MASQGGSLGFLRSDDNGDEQELRRDIQTQLKKTFRPEFLNRVDDVIVFEALDERFRSEGRHGWQRWPAAYRVHARPACSF